MSPCVLVIDDSEAVRRNVEDVLSAAGYLAILADSAGEGLRLWQETLPELVIAEVMMPESDGIELMLEMRRRDPRVKILAMTGFSHGGSVDFADVLHRLGADDVLLKPLAPEVLLAKVDRLISAPAALTAA